MEENKNQTEMEQSKLQKEIAETDWTKRFIGPRLAKVKLPGESEEVPRLIRMDTLLHRLEAKKGENWVDLGPLPTDVSTRLVKYLQRG